MSYVNNSIAHRVAEYAHKFTDSLHDGTSTASAAIGGAGGGAAFFYKYQSAMSEITTHLFSVCIYSAVGAATGVFVKFIAERVITRFGKSNNNPKKPTE